MRFVLYFLLLIIPAALASQADRESSNPVRKTPPDKHLSNTNDAESAQPGDADFLAAHDAFLAGDAAKLASYAKRLKKYPLEVYVSYYRLSLELGNLDQQTVTYPPAPVLGSVEGTVLSPVPEPVPDSVAAQVKNFLSRPQDTPLIDLLRVQWLKLLGKTRQWNLFDAEYPHLVNEDIELTCYAMQSRRRSQEQAVLHQAYTLWFTGKGLPDSCGTLFDAAQAAGIISEPDVLQRLRLALEANNVPLATKLAGQFEQYPDFSAMIERAAADPDGYLIKLMSPATPDNPGAQDIDTPISTVIAAQVSGVEPLPVPTNSHSADESDSSLSPGWSGWKNLWAWLDFGKKNNPPYARLSGKDQRMVALFALERLAKQSTDLAAMRWAKLAGHFPVDEQHYFYGRLAYQAARNLDARALQWYKAAGDTPLDDHQMAWRVRAALRAQAWPEVLASVNAMNTQQQQESAWLYWKARALQALDKTAEARGIFAPLSAEYSFYGQLASEELADSPVVSTTAPVYKPDAQAIKTVSTLPGVQRTLALYRMDLRSEALEEWRWVVGRLNDRELLTAAEIARRNKMYDRAIGAADKTINMHDFSMRYLAPYRADLQAHIREHGLDEAWVYGLMRQESRFATSAKSDSGAAGLMQIMPGTARWAANKLGLRSYRDALIHQLDINLRLGTYYMKSVLSQSENNPVLASAAYNAGPLRALQWRDDKPLEGAIYVETIPYEETRDYVKKVMSNTVYYADQFGDPPRSLKQRLGMVPGKTADNQAGIRNDK